MSARRVRPPARKRGVRPLWHRAAACLASGAALALTLPKPGFCFLAWCMPAVLFYNMRRVQKPRQAALLAWCFGAAYCGTALYWIYLTCRFAGVPVPIGVLALTALAAFLALSWALYGAVGRHLASRLSLPWRPWMYALLWVAIESAGARWTPRVGVDLLAYTQWRYLPMIQIGAVLGPHALAFVIVAWNAALASLADLDRTPWRRRNVTLAGALVLAVGLHGAFVLAGSGEEREDGPRVEIVQPNIDQYRKWDSHYEEAIRGAFDALLSRERDARPDLVLWPESSLPGWLDEPENLRWVAGWAVRLKAPILLGSVTRIGKRRHNSAVLIGPDGAPAGIYHKRQLVPFGEFVPLRPLFEGWIGILAQMGDFDAGEPRQPLLATPLGRMAATVCYEAVFPKWGRLDASRGARIFANVTNDGWYKDTWGPYQHFYTNAFRAVEDRVTVLRSANTGISGVIDPYGRVRAKTLIETPDRLDVRLPARDPFPDGSFYSRHGDWLGSLAMLVSVGSLLAVWERGRRRRPRRKMKGGIS